MPPTLPEPTLLATTHPTPEGAEASITPPEPTHPTTCHLPYLHPPSHLKVADASIDLRNTTAQLAIFQRQRREYIESIPPEHSSTQEQLRAKVVVPQ